ncbi:EAL domain-containing protein [Rhodopseudomonas sp. B29]|uniref:bifunctional diguanylate cyclase/phosphodiesterase n=1 Tax=Rhodopseudomonas sp. B29 TaxID=95607 RepID=UPI000345AE3B|nr:EAL domain-containing protein [Rhodopseudomonas sp. B29]
MYTVWNCLKTQHDWRLVLVAGLVCFLTSLAAVNLYQRACVSAEKVGALWLLTAGAVTGAGIWSTHFIAMMAYSPGFEFGYDLTLTLASLLVAAVVTTLGFVIAGYGGGRWGAIVGGGLIGCGIVAMHYMGMASLNFVIIWNREIVALSIVAGVVFGASAMMLAQRGDAVWSLAGASALLTLAIVSHHFIAMGAIDALPPLPAGEAADRVSPLALSLAIAVTTCAIVVAGLFAAMIDRSSHRRVAERSVQLDAALNNMGQGLCMYDAGGRLQLCNGRFLAMYRLSADDVQQGDTHDRLMQLKSAAGTLFLEPAIHRAKLATAIADRVAADWTTNLPDGREIHIAYQPIANGGWVVTHEDCTERSQNRARIEFLAHHDALTQLPNRIAFDQHINAAITEARAGATKFAVICIDLDWFKEINDIYGHSAGDDYLRDVARRLTEACGDAFVARIGGDEFVVITDPAEQPEAAEALCNRIIAAFEPDFTVNGAIVRGSCTLGVAIYPENGAQVEQLIANADAALYRAKGDQRGTYRFFETELDNILRNRRTLHKELIAAIEAEQFEAYFQPQATASGEVVGFEVLGRWNHPTKGLVSPAVFVPIAEETGLIREIDEIILRQACREAATWQRPLSIAVNLSPVDFRRGDLAGMILSILLETGLSADRLHIEITEGVLMEDNARGLNELRRIKALGVRLAMDDFGKGYSSLSYLLMFPFDKIKIDREFIAQLDSNPQSRAIVWAIIGLGHSLGLTVIAEGVEETDQLDLLIDKGCDQFQGYLLGHPQKASAYRGLADDGVLSDQSIAV